MRGKNNVDRHTDRQTDRIQTDGKPQTERHQYTRPPPNFFCGGYNYTCTVKFPCDAQFSIAKDECRQRMDLNEVNYLLLQSSRESPTGCLDSPSLLETAAQQTNSSDLITSLLPVWQKASTPCFSSSSHLRRLPLRSCRERLLSVASLLLTSHTAF